MKLAVSNIAWTNEEEPAVAQLLKDMGVKYIEIAPTKKWKEPTRASNKQVSEYLAFWESFGIRVVAFQSMLFSRPDLKIFESKTNRDETLQYLDDFISLASKMGVENMVFGSPKNRQRGSLANDAAFDIAKDFFTTLGAKAFKEKVQFCIEPNAPQYGCDFITNAKEGIEIVAKVNSPGFGLHLGIACMTLAKDNISQSIKDAAGPLKHFHISSPMLGAVGSFTDVQHESAAAALRSINYDGYVSIEMRPGDLGSNLERVRIAVEYAQSIY